MRIMVKFKAGIQFDVILVINMANNADIGNKQDRYVSLQKNILLLKRLSIEIIPVLILALITQDINI